VCDANKKNECKNRFSHDYKYLISEKFTF